MSLPYYCLTLPDIVISCAELDSTDLRDSTISLSHHKTYFPLVIDHQGQESQWTGLTTRDRSAAAGHDLMESSQAVAQLETDTQTYDHDLVQLFEGMRVEDYRFQDDESDALSITTTSECSLDNVEITTPTQDEYSKAQQQCITASSPNGADSRLAQDHSFEEPDNHETLPSAPGSPSITLISQASTLLVLATTPIHCSSKVYH